MRTLLKQFEINIGIDFQQPQIYQRIFHFRELFKKLIYINFSSKIMITHTK